MKSILIWWLAFTSSISYAQSGINPHIEVNVQWQYTDWEPTIVVAQAASFQKKIKLHLLETIKYLQSRSTDNLSSSQLQNRYYAINELEQYANQEVFPINEHTSYKTPVFIDNYGTHCAVGYLMKQSGAETLAQTIKENENLAYVFDIKTEGVIAWADKNGFTLDELALIQPSYFDPINSFDGVYFQTQTPSFKMISDSKYVYILTGDTVFSQYNQQIKGNYILVHDIERGWTYFCNFPKTEYKPKTLALAGGILYAATEVGLYYAVIKDKHPTDLEWFKHTTITSEISNIYTLRDKIYFVQANKGSTLIYDTYYNTMSECYGTSKYGSFFLIGDEMSTVVYAEPDYSATLIYEISHKKTASDEWVTEIKNNSSDMIPFRVNNGLNFNGTDMYVGKINKSSGQMQGGIHINWAKDFSTSSIFDSSSFQEDWEVKDMISTGNRLFLIGNFNKSLTTTNLPGKAIIELTNQGNSSYYPLPVSTYFDEVYAATLVQNNIFLSTDKGYFKYKFKFANITALPTENIRIFPNPISANQSLNIDLKDVKTVKVMDNLGRIVVESTSNLVTIPADATNGLYHCIVETKDGKHYFEKVVVE